MLAFTATKADNANGNSGASGGARLRRKIVEIAASAARPVPAGTQTLDLGDSMIAPGYLDLHIHGSAGFDVMGDNPEALPVVERLLARHGVTGYLPNHRDGSHGKTLRALDGWRMRSIARGTPTKLRSTGPAHWAFIWKGRSSATPQGSTSGSEFASAEVGDFRAPLASCARACQDDDDRSELEVHWRSSSKLRDAAFA